MLKWKENLKLKASAQFERNKKVNWSRIVYDDDDKQRVASKSLDDKDNDSFFRVKRAMAPESNPISFDNTKYLTCFHTWTSGKETDETVQAFDSIRDCFVTGKWDKGSDARHLLEADKDDDNDDSDVWDAFDEPYEPGSDDEELYGDFEDMETGEVHKAINKNGKNHSDNDDDDDEEDSEEADEENEDGKRKKNGDAKTRKKPKSEMTKRERLMEKKKRLKEQFDRGLFQLYIFY